MVLRQLPVGVGIFRHDDEPRSLPVQPPQHAHLPLQADGCKVAGDFVGQGMVGIHAAWHGGDHTLVYDEKVLVFVNDLLHERCGHQIRGLLGKGHGDHIPGIQGRGFENHLALSPHQAREKGTAQVAV